jgi:hypothetical protein
MALTPTEIDALPSYTAAQLLKVLERNIVDVHTAGQSYSVSGRVLTRADLPSLYEQRERLKMEIADAAVSDQGGGNVLVKFGEEQ